MSVTPSPSRRPSSRRPGEGADGGTVDAGEIARFAAMAAEWWDPRGKFRPLHKYNPVRLAYIRDAACRHFSRDAMAPRPLQGLMLLDVGCGGGLLSEPLGRLGATVTGIDAGDAAVGIAAAHAAESGVAVDYRRAAAEDLAAAGERFDIVVSLEVVEHVADVPLFLDALSTLTAPGGMIVLATINRTARAFALAVVGAEYVLRWLPRGTHDWRKFVRPSELAAGLRPHGFAIHDLAGVTYDPLRDRFSLNPRDIAVNYICWAARE